jgi:hypothetical protein
MKARKQFLEDSSGRFHSFFTNNEPGNDITLTTTWFVRIIWFANQLDAEPVIVWLGLGKNGKCTI